MKLAIRYQYLSRDWADATLSALKMAHCTCPGHAPPCHRFLVSMECLERVIGDCTKHVSLTYRQLDYRHIWHVFMSVERSMKSPRTAPTAQVCNPPVHCLGTRGQHEVTGHLGACSAASCPEIHAPRPLLIAKSSCPEVSSRRRHSQVHHLHSKIVNTKCPFPPWLSPNHHL